MEAYQDRLMDEYSELEERTSKLAEFIGSEAYNKVSVQDRDYLEAQLPVMQQYLRILTSRVAIMKDKKKATAAEKTKEVVKEPVKEPVKEVPAKK